MKYLNSFPEKKSNPVLGLKSLLNFFEPFPFILQINMEEPEGKSSKKSSFLRKDSAKYTDKLQKRGVVYLSRVPPCMKPNRVRSIFEQYGEITRLFLQEEDSAKRKARKARGGNGSKQFEEGWIEFEDKNIAKSVADSLNGKSIGSTKGDYYHDDVWTLKYLKGFKWDFLTEKLAYERRVRENKLKVAMVQAKKDNAEFAELVERSKVEEHVQKRKKKRQSTDEAAPTDAQESGGKKQRLFHQNKPIGKLHGEDIARIDSGVLKSILTAKDKKN